MGFFLNKISEWNFGILNNFSYKFYYKMQNLLPLSIKRERQNVMSVYVC